MLYSSMGLLFEINMVVDTCCHILWDHEGMLLQIMLDTRRCKLYNSFNGTLLITHLRTH